jgi:hypothetical protein
MESDMKLLLDGLTVFGMALSTATAFADEGMI